jgi:shikimate kinase
VKQPIVLVGPMGVGKTTVGKKLAKELETSFIDTDKVIVSNHGSIDLLFAELGELGFRAIESEVLASCLSGSGVVATGGGVVTVAANRELLAQHSVIYLSTNGKHIPARVNRRSRPLLASGERTWESIYEQRKPLYSAVATSEVDTSGKSLSEIVAEVAMIVRNQ